MDAAETTAIRIHVPWEPEVDNPKKSAFPSTDYSTERSNGDNGTSDSGRGDDHICFGKHLAEVRQRDGLAVERLRQHPGSRQAPIQNPDVCAPSETFCGDSRHFSCPDQCNNRMLMFENGLEESDSSMARGRFAGTDTRDPTDAGSDPSGVDEQIREGTAGRIPRRSLRRGLPDLLGHLLLANRKGIEAARDA